MNYPSLEAVRRFHQAVIDKNIEEVIGAYIVSPDTYVVLEGPRYTTKGYDLIAKGWRDFCDSVLNLESVDWVEGPFVEESHEMAWIAGIFILKVEAKGRSFEVKFRGTFIMTRDPDGNWKIKHEHVSAPLNDPYGIGDWLKK